MARFASIEDEWRAFLTGAHPGIRRGRHFWRLLPSSPRCEWCNAPFGLPGSIGTRLAGKKRETKNPRFCNACFGTLKLGGAEIELSLLFADVRGSTALAERLGPAAFRNLLNRFYTTTADVIVGTDGLVDKFVGDEVIGLYLPVLTGDKHAQSAIAAAQELLRRTGHGDPRGPWLPIGVGVHTGVAFVGAVGEENGVRDLTALGDPVNITARLASAAAQGEILITDNAVRSAAFAADALERRELLLKGKNEPVAVRVLKCATA
ncbi:MAG: adenylate/guanylate cyclase domain-containing protein [bacterium]|nr:adenylate/guanylate cyclase domain-containing protein [bacterium]